MKVMGPMQIFSLLFFLFLHWRAVAYETGDVHEGGMAATVNTMNSKGDRKMDIVDSHGVTPTTVPAEKETRGEGHFAATIDDETVGDAKEPRRAQDRSSGSGSSKEHTKGDNHVDSDTGKRNMVVDSGTEKDDSAVDSNTVKRRPILDNMEKDGNDYIRADLDEKERKQVKEVSMEAKRHTRKVKEAERNIFNPETATPEQLKAYNEQIEEPFVPSKRYRLIDESMYEQAAAEKSRFIPEKKKEYEDGRKFKYKPSEYAREQRLSTRSIPPEKITDNKIFDVVKFACDDTYGSHYQNFEIAEAREYKMPSQNSKDDIYTYKVTVDVYFPSFEPDNPHACTVEIFTVRSVKGKLSMVSHEISPLECMNTPKRKRSGRVWSDLQQRHKEL